MLRKRSNVYIKIPTSRYKITESFSKERYHKFQRHLDIGYLVSPSKQSKTKVKNL